MILLTIDIVRLLNRLLRELTFSIIASLSFALMIAQYIKVIIIENKLSFRGIMSLFVSELIFLCFSLSIFYFKPSVTPIRYILVFTFISILSLVVSFKLTNFLFRYPLVTLEVVRTFLSNLTLERIFRKTGNILKIVVIVPLVTFLSFGLFIELKLNNDLTLILSILFGMTAAFLVIRRSSQWEKK